MVNRNKRQVKELRSKIKDLWILGYNPTYISEKLLTLFNEKISPEGVNLHVKRIEREMEYMVSEDALDKYASEFIRMRNTFDTEIIEMTKIIDKLSDEDPKELEAKTKLINARHTVRLDKMKMLQDIELPIAVKKMKKERERLHGLIPVVSEPENVPPIEFVETNPLKELVNLSA